MSLKLICKICNTPSVSSLGEIEGYRADTYFDVLACSVCGSNFVNADSDDKIYEAIYKNVTEVPGYARYFHYARQVLKEKNPLYYLMNCEDCYWGIVQSILAETGGNRAKNMIWEVGCGQGYLTYALMKAGFNAIGLDISESAIALARQRYGNYYFCGDVKSYSIEMNKRPNYIILSEVIEHLSDPVAFLAELKDCLQPGGAIIVTTPNKSICSLKTIWDTELPPIHLWWFTEEGLEALGKSLSCQVQFSNMDEFYIRNVRFKKNSDDYTCRRKPILNKEYRVILRPTSPSPPLNLMLKSVLMYVLPKKIYRKIQIKMAERSGFEVCTGSTPMSLCATFKQFSHEQ